MIRSHFVILKELPSDEHLKRLKEGHQLFKESRTSLYYLTSYGEPLQKRPEFGGFLERDINTKINMSAIKKFLRGEHEKVKPRISDVNFDLIRQITLLSKQLNTSVFAIEITDDEYSNALSAKNGSLEYLRFRTSPNDARSRVDGYSEVVFRPDTGFEIQDDLYNHIYGLAGKAFEDTFNKSSPDFDLYCERKPTREESKKISKSLNMTIKSHQDSYGVFNLVSYAPPQRSAFSSLTKRALRIISYLSLPFILVGLALGFEEDDRKGRELSLWRSFFKGVCVFTIFIVILIVISRALLGY